MAQELKHVDPMIAANIGRPAEDGRAVAERMANDPRYSVDHKQQEIRRIGQEAAAEVEARAQRDLDDLDRKRGEWEKASYIPLAPATSEEAVILTYTRDALEQRTKPMKMGEIYSLWQTAINAGDKVTVRVMNDFADKWLQEKVEPGIGGGVGARGGTFDKLRNASIELLATADQRTARANLAKYDAMRQELNIVRGRALRQVQGLRLAGGKLVTGASTFSVS